jgi:hypothetical protein
MDTVLSGGDFVLIAGIGFITSLLAVFIGHRLP